MLAEVDDEEDQEEEEEDGEERGSGGWVGSAKAALGLCLGLRLRVEEASALTVLGEGVGEAPWGEGGLLLSPAAEPRGDLRLLMPAACLPLCLPACVLAAEVTGPRAQKRRRRGGASYMVYWGLGVIVVEMNCEWRRDLRWAVGEFKNIADSEKNGEMTETCFRGRKPKEEDCPLSPADK